MNQQILRAAALLLAAAGLAGCASSTPNMDAHFGESVTDLSKMQILNPGAERNAAIPSGMDGKAANSAYEQYQKSFKAPEPKTNVFTIGVGR
jgi:hypothetical protein